MGIDATAGLSGAWSSMRLDLRGQANAAGREASEAARAAEPARRPSGEAPGEAASAPPAEPVREAAERPSAPPPPGLGRVVDRRA